MSNNNQELMVFSKPQQTRAGIFTQEDVEGYISFEKEHKRTIEESDLEGFMPHHPSHFNQDLDYLLGKDNVLAHWYEPLDAILAEIQKEAPGYLSNAVISRAIWSLVENSGISQNRSKEELFHTFHILNQRLGLRFAYRQNKVQLVFNERLFQELTKSDISNLVIPTDTFDRLPYPSAWLVPPSPLTVVAPSGMKNHFLGFLYDLTKIDGNTFIRFFYYSTLEAPNGLVDPLMVGQRSFRIDGTTPLQDAIGVQVKSPPYDNINKLVGNEDAMLFVQVMNCLLYLVSKEPDIATPPAVRTLSKKSKMKMPIASVKLAVGQVIGTLLDTQYHPSKSTDEQGDGGSTKRPHLRRAHWRVVWLGSTAFGRGEGFQKSELRWIHPTLINADSADEIASVVRKVK